MYRDIVPRQDITEVIQDPTDIVRFNQLHYSNCAGELFLRYQNEEKEDDYPSCEMYKKCNEAIASEVGSKLDIYRNTQTVSGPAQQLQSPSDIRYIYDYLSDMNTSMCKTEEGEVITLGQVQPPWDIGDGSNYKLDKTYWSNEFVMFIGGNNRTTKVGYTEEATNDSYSPSKDPEANQIDRDVFRVLSGADFPLGGFWELIPSGGYAANSSLKAINEYTGGREASSTIMDYYTPTSPIFTDYFSSPVKDRLRDRKIASKTGLLSLSGLPRITGSLSNVNVESEGISLTPAQDGTWFQNILFEGPPSHYPFEDLAGAEELSGEQIPETDTLLKERNYGTRTAADAHYVTSPAYRRLVGLSENEAEDKKRYAPIGHDFLDSVLQTLSGDGDLTDLTIDRKFLEVMYGYYTTSFGEWLGEFIRKLRGKPTTIEDALDENKSFFDRYDADSRLGNHPGFTDDLKVKFDLSERNFMEKFPLPSPTMEFEINPDKPFDSTDVILDPYWLDREDWGEHGCYPWDGVGFKENCETAREEEMVSRTCAVDWCKKGSVGIMWTCNYGDEVAHDGHVTGVSVKNTNCNRNINQSKNRLICAQKQFTCLLELDENGNLPADRETGWVNSDIRSVESCIRWTAYAEEVEAALREENAPECPTSKEVYPKDKDDNLLPKPMPITLITPACNMDVAGPYTCRGNLEKDSVFMIENNKIRAGDDMLDWSEAYIADQEIRMNWQSPVDEILKPITAKAATFFSAKTSVRPEDRIDEIARAVDSLNPGTGGAKYNATFIRSIFGPPTKVDVNALLNPIRYHCDGELGGSGNWDCEIHPEPNPVEISLDSLHVEKSCAINPSQACAELIFKHIRDKDDIVPEFSETFLKVIGAAATEYQIPASALLAYMRSEGTLSRYAEYYSVSMEEEFARASLPWYGTVRNCNDVATNAQGPYNFLLKWFNFVLDGMGKEGRGVLNELSEGRGNTASRCNFLDESYATALTLTDRNRHESEGGCKSWDSTRLTNALELITFGTDPEGAHADDHFSEDAESPIIKIFKTCRY